jgi:uncharacterized protein
VIAVLLVLIAGILLFAHGTAAGSPSFTGAAQMIAGVVAGSVVGVIASLLGVAGVEFLFSCSAPISNWREACLSR